MSTSTTRVILKQDILVGGMYKIAHLFSLGDGSKWLYILHYGRVKSVLVNVFILQIQEIGYSYSVSVILSS